MILSLRLILISSMYLFLISLINKFTSKKTMSKFPTHRTGLQLVVNNSKDKMIVLIFTLNIINESFSIK